MSLRSERREADEADERREVLVGCCGVKRSGERCERSETAAYAVFWRVRVQGHRGEGDEVRR